MKIFMRRKQKDIFEQFNLINEDEDIIEKGKQALNMFNEGFNKVGKICCSNRYNRNSNWKL